MDETTGDTGDEVFKRLNRPSIYEMINLYKGFRCDTIMATGALYDTRLNIKFVNKHGWDWTEFLVAAKERGISTY